MGPLLTLKVFELLRSAADAGLGAVECSLDLEWSRTRVELYPEGWSWNGQRFAYPENIRARSVYHWANGGFHALARYTNSLVKLVPTEWGPPTFEIDGIKMLPTAHVSPYADAERKVGLIQPRGKVILDTCGGLGYFAAWCLHGQAMRIVSYEKNPDVVWLRSKNPWSPAPDERLSLAVEDVAVAIEQVPDASVDAVLHDPPRFGIAGELYSQIFYDQLARVLNRRGKLFHYVGSPNRLTTGRDVPNEVAQRLRRAGFKVQPHGDGVLAQKAV